MASVRRIRMKMSALPEPIITRDGRNLGTFLPGFSYTETPENAHLIEKVINDKRADWITPGEARQAENATLTGTIKVGK